MAKRPQCASEESIKADLRALTERTRQLRQELQEMLGGSAKESGTGTVHVPSWVQDRRTEVVTPPSDRRKTPKREG